jgi:hypothetical protein
MAEGMSDEEESTQWRASKAELATLDSQAADIRWPSARRWRGRRGFNRRASTNHVESGALRHDRPMRCFGSGWARAVLGLCLAWVVGCGASTPRLTHWLDERFDDSERLARNWGLTVPTAPLASVALEDGARGKVLKIEAGNVAATLSRGIDAAPVRSKRLRFSIDARAAAGARGHLRVTTHRTSRIAGYGDVATTPAVTVGDWTREYAVIDVPEDATSIELEIVAQGGAFWVDRVAAEELRQPRAVNLPRRLEDAELARLVALARAIGPIRYFHPSGEAASTDWNDFTTHAVERLLGKSEHDDLVTDLRAVVASVAPTAELYRGAPAREAGAFVGTSNPTRWRRAGFGDAYPYVAFRDRIDEPETWKHVAVRVPLTALRKCTLIRGRSIVESRAGSGNAELHVVVTRQAGEAHVHRHVLESPGSVTTDEVALPSDATDLLVRLWLSGEGIVSLREVSVECDAAAPARAVLDPVLTDGLGQFLYEHRIEPCGRSRCLIIERRDPAPVDLGRDLVDIDLGGGVRMRLPLALPADAASGSARPASPPTVTVRDRATRLAAVVSIWSTLRHFYPYFDVVDVDWDAQLPVALRAVAIAQTPGETHDVLQRMVASLRDAHARVDHAGRPYDGFLPVRMRKFGKVLAVIGVDDAYRWIVSPGSAVEEIDGRPALEVYAEQEERISAATDGWHLYATPAFMGAGPAGTWRTLRLGNARHPIVLPMLPRDAVGLRNREQRPAMGALLAPGIHYVDLEELDVRQWHALLPNLEAASAIVFDVRGYIKNAAFDVVAHLIDEAVSSPEFMVPVAGPERVAQHGYDRSRWLIYPAQPRLQARAIFLVDGRAASAPETLLQIVLENDLGVLVGEPSAGTNGNASWFTAPGGFRVRFTPMVIHLADGSPLHGRGITPHVRVVPTLAAVASGRDEILEAALDLATRQDHGAER